MWLEAHICHYFRSLWGSWWSLRAFLSLTGLDDDEIVMATNWVIQEILTHTAAAKKWNKEWAGKPHPTGGVRNTVSRKRIGNFVLHWQQHGRYRRATTSGRPPLADDRVLRDAARHFGALARARPWQGRKAEARQHHYQRWVRRLLGQLGAEVFVGPRPSFS
jgi:hypothetical protein